MDKPNTIPWPPIILATAVVTGVALHFAFPLPWLPDIWADFFFALGLLMAITAIAIEVSAFRTMSRHETTVMPHKASDALVTSGPFSFSRNPIYLANTMLMFSIALIFGIIWLLPAGLIGAFFTQKLAIEREEKHLEHKFGKPWRNYRKKVRRWI